MLAAYKVGVLDDGRGGNFKWYDKGTLVKW
jgi:hypothetical protein